MKKSKLIVLIIDCVALIQDEMSFFKMCYKKLISSKDGKKLKNKDLTVFVQVEAGLSSGNQIYIIKGGQIDEAPNEMWKPIVEELKGLGIDSSETLKNNTKIEKYTLSV